MPDILWKGHVDDSTAKTFIHEGPRKVTKKNFLAKAKPNPRDKSRATDVGRDLSRPPPNLPARAPGRNSPKSKPDLGEESSSCAEISGIWGRSTAEDLRKP